MISVLDSALFGDLFCVDDRIAAVFADRQRLADLLEVEVALARAEAAVGVIPAAAADAIAAAAAALEVDIAAIRRGVAASGVPTIELVRQLRRAVGPDNAGFVHRGATSQDIVDTAAILATSARHGADRRTAEGGDRRVDRARRSPSRTPSWPDGRTVSRHRRSRSV